MRKIFPFVSFKFTTRVDEIQPFQNIMAIFSIPSTAVGNSETRTARTAIADKQIQDLMHPIDPNPALTAAYGQYQQSRIGQRYKAGRGTNRGFWVNRGGEFAGRTPDETLGAIYNKSNPTPGSGPGGGLRTGSIQSGASQSSGIDWLKANRTTGPELAAQERAVAPKMTPAVGQPQPAFKPAPQSNFEAAKAAGQVTPDKIAQATAFGARFGQKFDPNTGYSPMGAQSPTTPAAPMPAPIVPNQSQAIAPVAAPVAPKPALTTGGLTTGSLSAPAATAAPATDNSVFNRLAANQATQPPPMTPEAQAWMDKNSQPEPKGVFGSSGPTGQPANQITADVRKANMAQIQSPEKGIADLKSQDSEISKTLLRQGTSEKDKALLRQKYNGMKPAFIPAKDRALMAG